MAGWSLVRSRAPHRLMARPFWSKNLKYPRSRSPRALERPRRLIFWQPVPDALQPPCSFLCPQRRSSSGCARPSRPGEILNGFFTRRKAANGAAFRLGMPTPCSALNVSAFNTYRASAPFPLGIRRHFVIWSKCRWHTKSESVVSLTMDYFIFLAAIVVHSLPLPRHVHSARFRTCSRTHLVLVENTRTNRTWQTIGKKHVFLAPVSGVIYRGRWRKIYQRHNS